MDVFKDDLSIPELEEKITEYWEVNQVFEKSLEKTKDGQPFTFYDGPPFATGLPHYGHILASTIKDVIPRYQTMRGRYVRRRWGWDCHGLPIEEIVERQLGISGKKQIEEIGIGKFNETCRAAVLRFADEWGKMVRRMGRFVEFENSYKTMDREYMESVWWAFKQIYDKGFVYEGRKVLLYCPRCETPVSNFEVAMDNSYKDVTEESVFVKFKITTPDTRHPIPSYLLAWTTTPWTLPGNVALAVGENINYTALRIVGQEGLYIVASDLVKKVFGEQQLEIVHEDIKGTDLAGLAYEPLFDVPAVRSDKTFKVYAADFVTTEEGTGIVHTAVVYGEDDYQLGIREGLPVVPLLDEKGHFKDEAPELIRGQYFKKADKAIKEDLAIRHLLFASQPHTHSYPHCWRCGTALFYNAIPAWFINIQKIKKDLLDSNEREINWYPEHLKRGRYAKSVEAAPDWNISRNRYWGNPIPVWKCGSCEKQRVMGSVKELNLPETTFYFVRHGEAENNVIHFLSTHPELKEYHLTLKGKEDVAATAKKLKDLGADVIYSSDLLRTRETAEVIAAALGKEVISDERLREFAFGVWNGKSYDDYVKNVPVDGWWHQAPDGGETHTALQNRMLAFMQEAALRHPGKKIAVVSHGDPIWTVWQKFGMEGYPKKGEMSEVKVDMIDLHRPYIDEVVLKCEKCGGEARRTPEIFDSWVEAGSMPFAEYHYPFENKEVFESRYPAQFVAEYIAQTRAWFYVMHVVGLALFGRAPFENVVTTGTILAEDGSKMSKSKQNFPDPWAVIEKYGVDSLRFYLINSVVMQADNLNFSEKDLGNVHRKVTMLLWNVYQYFVTYAPKSTNYELRTTNSPHILDRWISTRVKELVSEVTEGLDNYDTVHATRAIQGFVDDLSTWYLRRSRGREDASFYPTFRETLMTVAKVIAPFMPHIAEAIYIGTQNVISAPSLPHESRSDFYGVIPAEAGIQQGSSSVHLADWPTVEELTEDEKKLLADMEIVREAASAGLALRKKLNIPVRQPLAAMGLPQELSAELAEILKGELNVKNISREFRGEELTSEKGLKVSLDTALTDELRLEGLVRALERFVQEMRKQQGFKVGEMATLIYEAADADVEKALGMLNKTKTYLAAIEKGAPENGAVFESEGKKATLAIRRG